MTRLPAFARTPAALLSSLVLFAPAAWAQPTPLASSSPPPLLSASPPAAASSAATPPGSPAQETQVALRGQRCLPEQLEQLQREAPRFLVEVHAAQGTEAVPGVVVGPDQVVAPFYGVMDAGRSISVYFADGKRSSAKVARVDKEANLAVLTIDAPPPGLSPRPYGHSPPSIGMPLIALGGPLHKENKLAWEVQGTAVSALLDEHFSSANHPVPGAPLLSCSGELMGIQHHRAALSASALEQFVQGARGESGRSRWFLGAMTGAHLLMTARKSEIGFGLRSMFLDARLADQLQFRVNLAVLYMTPLSQAGIRAAEESRFMRFQTEVTAGYRIPIHVGSPSRGFAQFYLTPYLGAALLNEIEFRSRLSFDPSTCPQGACPVTRQNETISSSRVEPMIGLSTNLMGVDLSYAFQLNVQHPKTSTHVIGLGVSFLSGRGIQSFRGCRAASPEGPLVGGGRAQRGAGAALGARGAGGLEFP